MGTALQMMGCWWSGPDSSRPQPRLANGDISEIRNKMRDTLRLGKLEFISPDFETFIHRLAASPKFNTRNFVNIHSTPSIPAIVASAISVLQNQNLTYPEVSPAYTDKRGIEKQCIGFLAEIVGFNSGNGYGHLTSGGTTANLTAIAAARDITLNKASERVRIPHTNASQDGLASIRAACKLVTTAAAHYSIRKAGWIAGLGSENTIVISTKRIPDEIEKYYAGQNEPFSLQPDTEELVDQLKGKAESGIPIVAAIATIGTTATGSIEPPSVFFEAAREAGQSDLFVHVDAATGGLALLDPDVRAEAKDVGKANTITIDPHKWGYVPYPCGGIIFRQEQDYSILKTTNESANLQDLVPTLEGSRSSLGAAGFYANILALGKDGYRQIIQECRKRAKNFSALISDDSPPLFIVLHKVQLNTVAFTIFKEDAAQSKINDWNENLFNRINDLGSFMIGFSRRLNDVQVKAQNGERADLSHLRVVFTNPLTTDKDVAALVDLLKSEYKRIVR